MSEETISIINPQAERESPAPASEGRAKVIGYLIVIVFIGGFVGLPLLDNTTDLLPVTDRTAVACLWLTGICAVAGILVFFARSEGVGVLKRIWTAAVLGLIVAVWVGFVSYHLAHMLEGWITFRPAKTRTFTGGLFIDRAYHTHGKGASAQIITTPLYSDMKINESDYVFMRQHRMPGDAGQNPDRIASHGYFCAKVTMQQSGENLRVLHAGGRSLPAGSVILCPVRPPQTQP